MKNLPDDADDTSIIALELLRHGVIDRSFVLKNTCTILKEFRLRNISPPAPEWLRPGVFLTWLSGHEHRNIVDCCVNANVVALFAYAGITHWNGYREACEMIDDGIRWAGDSLQRARFLTPFYPHPIELFYALRYAITQGAIQLVPALQKLTQASWAAEDINTAKYRPICSSAYGGVVWSSSILQKIRLLEANS